MAGDPWLDAFMPLVKRHALVAPVLELGCGGGRDTAVLVAAGCTVVALDQSARAVANARLRAPAATLHCQDMREAFPPPGSGFGMVVASLSLHYFGWSETLANVTRIRQALLEHGILLCRLNSTRDIYYGAHGHPEIDAHYYRVDGQPKRFFDRADLTALFASGWRLRQLEEKVIDRYEQPKHVWEAVVEKAAADPG